MIILVLRTDKPEAELGLYEDNKRLAYKSWPAHRQLAETIHKEITALLESKKLGIKNIEAVVGFQGPGSFTGLRIGLSVANALAASLEIPIVGTGGKDWVTSGIVRLLDGANDDLLLPEYGSVAHTTTQKK